MLTLSSSLLPQKTCGLLPFIMAGDPDLPSTAAALKIFAASGVAAIELGIPYSDPLADGPVIHAAATRALKKGITLESVLAMLADVLPQIETSVILFTYYNLILYQGVEKFLSQVSAVGVKGLVVPDLPLEESSFLREIAAKKGIQVTLLVAPTTPLPRIQAIAEASSGFIYLVSVTGVTGMRSQVAPRVYPLLQKIRQVSNKPVGIGFGISQPEQVSQIKQWGADAVIIGSAFVNTLHKGTLHNLECLTKDFLSVLNT